MAVLNNDSDPDGDVIYISQYTGAQIGNVSLSGQEIVYTPNTGAVGEDTFNYVVSDVEGATAMATVRIFIEEQNQAPVANNDSASTVQGNAVAVNVLLNDYDPNGDSLSISGFTQAANGTVVLFGSALNYQPNADFTGSDQFTYTITDGEFQTSATVVMTVAPETTNQPPVAEDDQATVIAGEEVTVAPLSNDTDPEGQPLVITAVTQPRHGQASLAGDFIVYLADANHEGTDTFTYTVSDGELDSTGSVTITASLPANTAPVVAITSPTSGSNHSAGQPITLSATAEDAEDGDLSSGIVWTSSVDGTLFTGSSGSVTLSSGQHSLQAAVSDGQGIQSVAEVTIYVRDESGVFANTQTFNIPDGNGKGVESPITVSLGGLYSTLYVAATFYHPSPSDIGIQLISPSGRHFNLDNPNMKDNNRTWTIELNKALEVSGEWKLRVADHKKGRVGSLTGWTVRFE